MGKIKEFIQKPTLFGEIIRFLLVGGVSTVVDFLVMAVTMYIFAPDKYDSFLSIFFGTAEDPSGMAAIVGTGLGFIFGLVINYLFSILFVFNESSFAKSAKGIFTFALFSLGGLFLHELGMLLFFGWLGINEWIVKIFMTLVVLVYNFTTRRAFVFRKGNQPTASKPNSNATVAGPAIVSKHNSSPSADPDDETAVSSEETVGKEDPMADRGEVLSVGKVDEKAVAPIAGAEAADDILQHKISAGDAEGSSAVEAQDEN